MDTFMREQLDLAMDVARHYGAEHADLRIRTTQMEHLQLRNGAIADLEQATSEGIGVRILLRGAWGFAATPRVTRDAITKMVRRAVQIARTSGRLRGAAARLAPEPVYRDRWATPVLIDPFSEFRGRNIERIFLANLRESGAADRTTVIKGFSQEELRKLPSQSYDIIYVDGSHAADDVLEDAVLSWRLLKDGGLLIFDDYEWSKFVSPQARPKIAITAFVRCYRPELKIIHRDYQVIVQKR